MKKLNVLTLALITAVTACGPQAPRDVKVSKDLTPLHANVPTNVKAVAPSFVSEKSPSPATWFFWPSKKDIKENGEKLVPYLSKNLSYDKKIREISAFVSEYGKEYLDKIIEENNSKKEKNIVESELKSLETEIETLSSEMHSHTEELKFLSCKEKAPLYKFKVDGRKRLKVLKASSSRVKKVINELGPLEVEKKPVDVCLPKNEIVSCKEILSKKAVNKYRNYKKVFKTMAKTSRYGWTKTAGWDKKVNVLEIAGVKYLCPTENTFKYAQDKKENFPYSISKKTELNIEEIGEKEEMLNVSIESISKKLDELSNLKVVLENNLNEANSEYNSLGAQSTEILAQIMGHLDVDLDNDGNIEPEENKNFLKVNSEETSLVFEKCGDKTVPVIKIKRDISIKHSLTYESSSCGLNEDATITDVKYFVEKNTPVLKFKIKELGQSVDVETKEIVNVPTGKFFHVKLKQNKAPFGIEYVGEFDYKNKAGKILRTGIMKWAFIK